MPNDQSQLSFLGMGSNSDITHDEDTRLIAVQAVELKLFLVFSSNIQQ